MAKELVSPTGGPGCQYHILLTKIKLAKNELEEAEKHCCEALSFDYQVFIFIKDIFQNIYIVFNFY